MLNKTFKFIFFLFIFKFFVEAQGLEEIISLYNSKISKFKEEILDLEVTQKITVETEGMTFEERAIIYLKGDKKAKRIIEVKGKKMPEKIPDWEWILGPKISEKDYFISLLGEEKVEDEECFKICLKPKRVDDKLINGFIWLSKDDHGILKMENTPLKKPSLVKELHIIHLYSKSKEGIRFLQKRTVYSTVKAIFKDVKSITNFEYTKYKVNLGLKEEIFK
jgi:outer membrane lipoprotein-sorting protein